MSHRPRKRFGQNFLQDPGIIQRIIQSAAPGPGQAIVEIGPGLAALTLPLLRAAGSLDVVELDRDLLGPLQAKCAGEGELRIHSADALKFDFCALAPEGKKLRVMGNLPYNISTPLIFHLLEQSHCIQDMHFMLQKEVVERLAAQPGTSEYGRLGVMVQYHCRVEKLFTVPPGAFRPPPKVYSAVVRLTPYQAPPVQVKSVKTLSMVVSQAFSQRRKTLRNTLKQWLTGAEIEALGIDPGRRPETLSLAEFARLADTVADLLPPTSPLP